MTPRIVVLLTVSAALAAAGQVMFKVGAAGRQSIVEFANLWIAVGLLTYALSTAIWIYSLSKAALTSVYPFTALTFVLAYLAGITILRESVSLSALLGVTLVVGGLCLVIRG